MSDTIGTVSSEDDVVLSALETGSTDPLPTAADEQVRAVARYQTWVGAQMRARRAV